MLPEPPLLPEGYRHLFTPQQAQARGYWSVHDGRYEKVWGHFAGKTDDGRSLSEARLPDGTIRRWVDGVEVTPSKCRDRWLDRIPSRLRCNGPWQDPHGYPAEVPAQVRVDVVAWIDSEDRRDAPLLLYGDPGAGKSQTAAWIGLMLADQGVDAVWCHAPTTVQQMRASYGGDRDAWSGAIEGILAAPFLVVDDLGAEIGGKDVAELAYRIADRRYNSRLATVWTTNIVPSSMVAAGYDPRTVSRIASGTVIKIAGRDYRKG